MSSIQLFYEEWFHEYLKERRQQIAARVDSLPSETIFKGNTRKLMEDLTSEFSESDFTVSFDRATARVESKKIPGWKHPRMFQHRVSHQGNYKRQVVVISVPFSGDERFLRYRPREHKPLSTEVQVVDGAIQFELINFYDDSKRLRKEKDNIIRLMEDQYTFLKKEREAFNKGLSQFILSELDKRVSEAERQEELLREMGFKNVVITDSIGVSDDVVVSEERGVILTPERRFDVAISYAGEDIDQAKTLVGHLQELNITTFFAPHYRHELWGKDMSDYFVGAFGEWVTYVVLMISKHYVLKSWTDFELTIARGEAGKRNVEFILPVRLDDTLLPGIRSTVNYLDYIGDGPETIAKLLKRKLSSND